MKNLRALDPYRLKNEEIRIYGTTGDDRNGYFKVFVGGRSFFVIAASGGEWDHVSVTPCNKKRKSCPTWDEMCAIKDMFFEPEETVVQYHPAKSNYVNLHQYCLHLWKPQKKQIPMPPEIMV